MNGWMKKNISQGIAQANQSGDIFILAIRYTCQIDLYNLNKS